MASEHERRLTEYEAQVDQLQERSRDSRKKSSSCDGVFRTRPSASGRSRNDSSRPRASSPRPCPRTRSSRPPCARRASTSRRCAKRSRSSRCRRRRTARISARTTTAPSTSSPPAARCASPCTPSSKSKELRRGQEVVLNESLNVVLARNSDLAGEIVTFKELLPDGTRAMVVGRADEERVCELADELLHEKLRAGDHLLMEGRSGLLLEKLPRPEVEELVLEEVPDVSYDDVGGLDDQIEMIKDAVELPYLYGDLFKEHDLQPPKGILLYGPPGCGKTLIAKAVANSLAKRVAEKTGNTTARSYFLNIKGPELLEQVRRRDRAPDPPHLPAGPREERRGLPGHRVLRRDGLAVPHPRYRHLERHRVDDRAAAARRDRRRRGAEERHRDRRVEPRGPHRPRDPASRPPRREDQDRAARRRRARSRSSRSTSPRACRSPSAS